MGNCSQPVPNFSPRQPVVSSEEKQKNVKDKRNCACDLCSQAEGQRKSENERVIITQGLTTSHSGGEMG